MCGITGVLSYDSREELREESLRRMADAIEHRGPDETSTYVNERIGFGFKRLSIIDLAHGHQPFFTVDNSVVMVCNGEIYNYRELQDELKAKGHQLTTNCDVEVILYLYLEYGIEGCLNRLNGQFAFAIYDKRSRELFLARDHFGICPLFYTVVDGQLIFGSEIKSILHHPGVKKEVDVTGLDQVFSFPGMVSPTTMFKGIRSLKPGYYVVAGESSPKEVEYWDLDYPPADYDYGNKSEDYYMEGLEAHLLQSVKYRLNADVPVGFYLSGGLDSSLVGALMKAINPDKRYSSFSIGFPDVGDQEHDERNFQRIMARHLNSMHTEIGFDWSEVDKRLKDAVFYGESPLKETYNTCSLALSEAVHQSNTKVVLSGEGADELLGGYIGYRFDKQRNEFGRSQDLEELLEEQMRKKLWGDPHFFYEKRQHEFKETKQAIYSGKLNERYAAFDCLERLEINKGRLDGRDNFHKRSYLDLKLRLSDHLIADHCDRVTYANSVEGRYPFLDIELLNFIRTIPADVKLNGLIEKYILKKLARKYLPPSITDRQKFSFVAPNSSHLIKNNIPWINDMLSYDRIKRQGYFNPDTIERLKKMYKADNFKLNLPFDDDLLIVVLTFNIFLEIFDMPDA
ncbi:MAG: asparagine synthase (glutamine-hydrolyzing) [Cyclobacteriaceae bacterium]